MYLKVNLRMNICINKRNAALLSVLSLLRVTFIAWGKLYETNRQKALCL